MTYLRPDTLKEALEALEEGAPRVAAGCTDLFPATETRTLQGPILDITGIDGLRGVKKTGTGWVLGATTTWTDILRADLPPAFDGLKLAAREVGATQIQNRGTLAGNLCNASPAADGVPPLLTLNAEVELASRRGRRRLPLNKFITGPRAIALAPDEMVVAVHVPNSAGRGVSGFLKLGARHYLVISIAMCAARLVVENGKVSEAALAVGACGPVAVRLPEVEAALVGHPMDPGLVDGALVTAALHPIDDVRADARYRSEAAVELLRRLVVGAAEQEAQAA